MPAKPKSGDRRARAQKVFRDVDTMSEGMLMAFGDLAEDYPDLPIMDLANVPYLQIQRVLARLRELVQAADQIDRRGH